MFPRLPAGNGECLLPSRNGRRGVGRGAHSRPLLGPETFRSHATLWSTKPVPLLTVSLSLVPAREKRGLRAFMKNNRLGGPPPAPPAVAVRAGAGAARGVPPLRRVVERVGVAQRGGGAPRARRVRVEEVLQRVSVLVVRLVLRPARVAGGRRSGQGKSLSGSAGTRRTGLARIVLLSKDPPRRTATSSGAGEGVEVRRKIFPIPLSHSPIPPL